MRQLLLLMWIAVGGAWAYAFTLVGKASWNFSWTLLLWLMFTALFGLAGFRLLTRAENAADTIAQRLERLEARVNELETDSTEQTAE